jgi:hypothetical protein
LVTMKSSISLTFSSFNVINAPFQCANLVGIRPCHWQDRPAKP